MAKWLLAVFLLGMAAGVALWVALDRNAQAAANTLVMRWDAEIKAGDILAPIASAFQGFSDSVAKLWSPDTIRIEMPSIHLPNPGP